MEMIRQNQDLIWGLCSLAFLKSSGAQQRHPAPARTALGQHSPVRAMSHPPPRAAQEHTAAPPQGSFWLLVPQGCCTCLWGGAQHPSGMCFLAGLAMGTPGNPNSTFLSVPPSRHCSGIRHLNPPGHREMADTR